MYVVALLSADWHDSFEDGKYTVGRCHRGDQETGFTLQQHRRQYDNAGRTVRRRNDHERRVLRLLRAGNVPRCVRVQPRL